jgi:hypothetical protein
MKGPNGEYWQGLQHHQLRALHCGGLFLSLAFRLFGGLDRGQRIGMKSGDASTEHALQ